MPRRGEWKGPVQVQMADTQQACRMTHPVLKIGNGTVRGGSAYDAPKGMDIYVGHEKGMERHDKYPWEEGSHPVDIFYYMADGRAPGSPEVFKKMIKYLADQLEAGKNIAIGCVAGHGRSGTTIAALYKEVTGDADAIKWVRENYCKKAVESKEQVDFLVKHFGITAQKGTKEDGLVTFHPTLPSGGQQVRAMPDPRDRVYRLWGPDVRLTNW